MAYGIEQNWKKINDFEAVENNWKIYNSLLFKRAIPTVFEDLNKNKFMGIIQSANPDGTLSVLLENDTLKTFKVKEVTMLY